LIWIKQRSAWFGIRLARDHPDGMTCFNLVAHTVLITRIIDAFIACMASPVAIADDE
jgi:hypothetical protein